MPHSNLSERTFYTDLLQLKQCSPRSRVVSVQHELNTQTLEVDSTYKLILNLPHPLRGQVPTQHFYIKAETLSMMGVR